MDKKQREAREARRRQEDIALQRSLMWVAGAVVLEALLVLVNRFYINYMLTSFEVELSVTLDRILRALRFGLPAAALLALVWTLWLFKQEKKFGPQLVLTLVLAAVTVCTHVIVKFQGPGVSMLFWLVIAWAVLALVYYIYQREFFLGACACGMSVLALWFVRYGASGRMEALVLLAAILLVSAACVWLKKSGGLLPGPQAVQFLPRKTSYSVLLTTCLASVAAVVVALLAGGIVAYYLVFVMVAWLFALFVYYTVKLM